MTARARHLAATLRARFNIDRPPVPDQIIFLNSGHVHVMSTEFPTASVGGALYRGQDGGAVIWLHGPDPIPRRRFTLFHEYGHFLMHEGIFFCQTRDRRTSLVELEANAFAVEMLMPKAWILRDAAERGPANLHERYGVSRQAMDIRLKELGLR